MKRALIGLYRIRGPIYVVAAAVLIGSLIADAFITSEALDRFRAVAVPIALLAGLVSIVLTFTVRRLLPDHPVTAIASPVHGRWRALNSPASAVPSHGVRMYGQSHAIDLVYEPDDDSRPVFGSAGSMRPNSDYPGFGQPVFAMSDGVVVAVSHWRRDHRARSSMTGVLYLMIEGMVREIGGSGFIIGNHVTIRTDDGAFALVAHLQHGSARVRIGDRVRAGDQIGRCGNSGNSSEPHVHAQLMDRRSPWTAQGLPISFSDIRIGDDPTSPRHDNLPANDEVMHAAAPGTTD